MLDKEAVQQMVRRVVYRTLGMPVGAPQESGSRLVTATDVRDVPTGGRLEVPPGALITPLARQVALDRKVALEKRTSPPASPASDASRAPDNS